MKKLGVFVALLLFSPLIAGLYGIIHDQLTFTVSPEYYTKFKFIQFGLIDEIRIDPHSNVRMYVAAVGFMATWWFGLFLGAILSLVGLIHRDASTMLRTTLKAIGTTTIVALAIGLIGLLFGRLVLANKPATDFQGWFIPENLVEFENFIAVGSMHNFSYAGGLIGLLAGIVYSISVNRRNRVKHVQSVP